MTLAGGAKLVAIVTHSSQQALGLAKGKEAIALIKAPWVTLATEDCGLKFSARNQFAGSVSTITEGAVNATATISKPASVLIW
ncbi:TOBE domain-containing protein, partial [Enterobacter hormaechei subsp. steigerwaltii]|nr:TOBE domain-containing protein [Enterobacter hormaechei subsp. steigerwaltii]